MSPLAVTSADPPATTTEGTTLLVTLTRMEGKLDAHLIKHEALKTTVDDHESRVRALEAKPTVSPLGLWSTVLGALGAVSVLVTLYNVLIP